MNTLALNRSFAGAQRRVTRRTSDSQCLLGPYSRIVCSLLSWPLILPVQDLKKNCDLDRFEMIFDLYLLGKHVLLQIWTVRGVDSTTSIGCWSSHPEWMVTLILRMNSMRNPPTLHYIKRHFAKIHWIWEMRWSARLPPPRFLQFAPNCRSSTDWRFTTGTK